MAVGDINNDGWPDLYITNLGSNQMYLNKGDGTFVDVTRKTGRTIHAGVLALPSLTTTGMAGLI